MSHKKAERATKKRNKKLEKSYSTFQPCLRKMCIKAARQETTNISHRRRCRRGQPSRHGRSGPSGLPNSYLPAT